MPFRKWQIATQNVGFEEGGATSDGSVAEPSSVQDGSLPDW
jgi:hypothetical protein